MSGERAMNIPEIRKLMSKNPYRVIQHKEGLDLLDALEQAIGLLREHRAWPSRHEVNERIEAFLTTHGASE